MWSLKKPWRSEAGSCPPLHAKKPAAKPAFLCPSVLCAPCRMLNGLHRKAQAHRLENRRQAVNFWMALCGQRAVRSQYALRCPAPLTCRQTPSPFGEVRSAARLDRRLQECCSAALPHRLGLCGRFLPSHRHAPNLSSRPLLFRCQFFQYSHAGCLPEAGRRPRRARGCGQIATFVFLQE